MNDITQWNLEKWNSHWRCWCAMIKSDEKLIAYWRKVDGPNNVEKIEKTDELTWYTWQFSHPFPPSLSIRILSILFFPSSYDGWTWLSVNRTKMDERNCYLKSFHVIKPVFSYFWYWLTPWENLKSLENCKFKSVHIPLKKNIARKNMCCRCVVLSIIHAYKILHRNILLKKNKE